MFYQELGGHKKVKNYWKLLQFPADSDCWQCSALNKSRTGLTFYENQIRSLAVLKQLN